MKYKIYRNNDVVATVRANGSLTEKIFGEETLTMDFTLNHFILFKIGDRVSVYDKNYYIVEEPSVEKISTRQYRYNLTFNGVKYRLGEIKYFFYDHENQLTVSEFSITGTASKMLELVVANTNRAGQLGWRIGKVSTMETKTVDFSDYNCLAALTRIAEEFDIELWIGADKSIHLENRTQSSGYRLEYGKSKGIKSISRNPYTEANLVTRLYAQGGAKNLPANYRSGQKRLRMPVPYLEKNTAFYGVVEHLQNFDEIYPKRVGKVTKVFDNEPRMFADETLDFDLNEYNQYGSKYLIAGTSAKVIFQTGDLAGYILEVQKGGFNSKTKAFTLLKNKEEKAFEIPSAQFKPRVGDKYILVDIMMPEAYVLAAERELQAAAQKYLDKNSKQRFVYGIVPDPLYLKKINFSLKLGNTIRFKDADFGLDADIRVVSITRDINNPYLTTFEIAEQATITQLVRNYIEKEKRDNIIIAEQRKNEQRISEAYETMQEIQNNTFDADGYFKPEKIKPLSIETKMLSVGAPLQQFDLFDVIIFQSSANEVKNTAGTLIHYTIADSPKTWNIAQGSHTLKANEASYIYAKCERNGNRGTILCTSKKIAALSDGNYYHFELGYISTLKDKEVRKIKLISGFTAINGGEITTGRITSQDGNNWIDIKEDEIEINAKVQFASDSPALSQLKNYVDQSLTNISIAKGNIDKSILDGVIAEADAKAIEMMLENLKSEFTGINQQAVKILEKVSDAEILNAKNAYEHSFNELSSLISSAIADKGVSDAERQRIKEKFEDYRTKITDLTSSIEKLNWNARERTEIAYSRTERLQKVTDFLSTTIDGDVISTGVLQVGGLDASGESKSNAGISGTTEKGEGNDVRFWAGSTAENKDNAPFRVLENGSLFSTAGEVGGFRIDESSLGSYGTGNEFSYIENRGTQIMNASAEAGWRAIQINKRDLPYEDVGLVVRTMRLREGRRLVALRLDAANISGIKNSENIALDITSGLTKINDRLYQKGQKVLFSTGYIGRAYDNVVKDNYRQTHDFVFNQVNGNITITLPSTSDIKRNVAVDSYNELVSFELNFLVTKRATGRITIQGAPDAQMLNSDGGIIYGGNGYLYLTRGDSVKVRYADGDYYLIQERR
ncbi:hypothetical protein EDL99_10540 [Ornithobacterium rhinotracheale]|uniref:phage tail protein n=1 Tax=Ornithobacterium rhinotracheale TaxID=28251 RepID=UPI00129C7146|nr:phage tail protein [Ornithobacterium rhinotracheale]MRJ09292.1 hypothetical protein [Ornithobacterium rhinotracheale]UOH77677.1 phage tail protein [Ornithobacterium rhinotracheale]